MIDVAKQDYIEAARAFGVPDRVRVFKYMLRPAFVPPMTILGLEFASLIGNAFVVELVFAWPGMASYGVRSILQKDLNAVMGVVMISGVFFVVANLVIDVLVGFVDPRVRIRGARMSELAAADRVASSGSRRLPELASLLAAIRRR